MPKVTNGLIREQLSRCTAQHTKGDFCDEPSVPDAPFPICARHARQAYMFGASLVREMGAPDRALIERFVGVSKDLKPKPQLSGVVYFVRVAGLIKIGYSTRWSGRRTEYPPNTEVLHVHHSSHAATMEKRFHHQFGHLRRPRTEWFVDNGEIVDFIGQLKADAA